MRAATPPRLIITHSSSSIDLEHSNTQRYDTLEEQIEILNVNKMAGEINSFCFCAICRPDPPRLANLRRPAGRRAGGDHANNNDQQKTKIHIRKQQPQLKRPPLLPNVLSISIFNKTMDAVIDTIKAQLVQLRSKLDDIPVLQKLEVSKQIDKWDRNNAHPSLCRRAFAFRHSRSRQGPQRVVAILFSSSLLLLACPATKPHSSPPPPLCFVKK